MDAAGLEDLLAPFAKVQVRKMFGGLGAYHEGLIFAIVTQGQTFLRTDAETEPLFAAAGSMRWEYKGKNNDTKTGMPYWRLPEAAHDEEDELVRFCRLAMAAARRAKAGKTKGAAAKRTAVGPAKAPSKAATKKTTV